MFKTFVGELLFDIGISAASFVFKFSLQWVNYWVELIKEFLVVGVVVNSGFEHVEEIDEALSDLRWHHIFLFVDGLKVVYDFVLLVKTSQVSMFHLATILW